MPLECAPSVKEAIQKNKSDCSCYFESPPKALEMNLQTNAINPGQTNTQPAAHEPLLLGSKADQSGRVHIARRATPALRLSGPECRVPKLRRRLLGHWFS